MALIDTYRSNVIRKREAISKLVSDKAKESDKIATKKKIIEHLNDNCKIMIDMNIELVSASYVATKLKCRGEFIKSNTDDLENNLELSGKDSMCFWGGNIIYSKKDVTARMKS